jgi:hypothetical protein
LYHFDQLPIDPIKIVCLQQEKWISGGNTFAVHPKLLSELHFFLTKLYQGAVFRLFFSGFQYQRNDPYEKKLR